jgi:HK97 family phage portal protein
MPPVVTTAGRRREPQQAWVANPAPRIYTHWQEFLRQVVVSYYATGEAFIVVTGRYADGYPATFMLVDPWNVSVDFVDGVRDYSINGLSANGDILHIRYASWPGDARGHGPLEVAGERILAVQTLMRYGSEIAANPQPWGILKSKYALTAAQSTELKNQWISAARSRNGAPAVLGADLDLTLAQVTPKDMTLSELQQFAEARLSVLLGVPPYILGLPSGGDSLTYSNVSQIFEFWYRSSLKATKDYLAQAISAWALPAGTDLQLSETGFTQPSALERAQYYELGLRDGWLTIAEVRASEKLSPDGLTAISADPTHEPAPAVQ